MRSICSLLPSWPATTLPTRTSGFLSSIMESNARECKQSMLEPRLRRRCPRLWDPNPSVLIAGPVLGILLNDLLQLLLQGSSFIPAVVYKNPPALPSNRSKSAPANTHGDRTAKLIVVIIVNQGIPTYLHSPHALTDIGNAEFVAIPETLAIGENVWRGFRRCRPMAQPARAGTLLPLVWRGSWSFILHNIHFTALGQFIYCILRILREFPHFTIYCMETNPQPVLSSPPPPITHYLPYAISRFYAMIINYIVLLCI